MQTNFSLAQLAEAEGRDPIDVYIDRLIASEGKELWNFWAFGGALENQWAYMRMAHCIPMLADSGAHVAQIMDSSLQTHLLSYWVREREALSLEEAVRKITYDTSTLWGFHDRGLVRSGMAADLVIFDPETVGASMPEVVHDLPAGAKRLKQLATGISHTIVAGEVLLENNVHTGATPGRLIRV